MKDEALRLLLEAIEICAVRQEHQWYGLQLVSRAKAAAKQALEQPEPEPVVTVYEGAVAKWNLPEKFTGFLYTSSPKREWQGLTDEEWQDLCDRYDLIIWSQFKQEVESKLKEKNT